MATRPLMAFYQFSKFQFLKSASSEMFTLLLYSFFFQSAGLLGLFVYSISVPLQVSSEIPGL